MELADKATSEGDGGRSIHFFIVGVYSECYSTRSRASYIHVCRSSRYYYSWIRVVLVPVLYITVLAHVSS